MFERRVVDDRVFLLGLDKLYRDAMKQHERGELLGCARRVAEALHVTPADVPVEGYYAEDERLTEYFRLVRALQDVDEGATSCRHSLVSTMALYDRRGEKAKRKAADLLHVPYAGPAP